MMQDWFDWNDFCVLSKRIWKTSHMKPVVALILFRFCSIMSLHATDKKQTLAAFLTLQKSKNYAIHSLPTMKQIL